MLNIQLNFFVNFTLPIVFKKQTKIIYIHLNPLDFLCGISGNQGVYAVLNSELYEEKPVKRG